MWFQARDTKVLLGERLQSTVLEETEWQIGGDIKIAAGTRFSPQLASFKL